MTSSEYDAAARALRDGLHHRADGLTDAPFGLDEVRARAGAIRRTRRITAAAAVAAAVAILTPAGILAGGGWDRGATPQYAGQTPRAEADGERDGDPRRDLFVIESSRPRASGPQRLVVTDLPVGEPPAVPWYSDGTLHLPGSGSIDLPPGFAPLAPYDDGWLLVGWASGAPVGQVVDADGDPVGEPFRTLTTAAAAADGGRTLYGRAGDLVVHDNVTGQDAVVRRQVGPATEPVGFAGPAVYYNLDRGDGRTMGWSAPGLADPAPEGTLSYRDVTPDGWTAAVTSVSDAGSCSAVFAPSGGERGSVRTGERVGQSCRLSLEEFSDNGGLLLAGPAYRDGFGDRELAVVSPQIRGLRPPPRLHFVQTLADDAVILDSTWEDEDHLLVVTFRADTWQLLRVGLDGSVENAVEPVAGDDAGGPGWGFLPR